MTTYYSDLELDEFANNTAIKSAFRRLSMTYHPDKNNGDAEKFKKVNSAYELLSDEEKKRAYDIKLRQSHYCIDGILNKCASTANTMLSEKIRKNPDINLTHIDKILQGLIKTITQPQLTITDSDMSNMSNILNDSVNKFQHLTITTTIHISLTQSYNGGNIPVNISRNVSYNNTTTIEQESIYIDLYKGIDTNECIIIPNKGNICNENVGDVKVFIVIENDTEFERIGLDLIYKKTISLKEALCGFSFRLEHFNQKPFLIENATTIQPNTSKVIPNIGMIRSNNIGSLIIKFNVELPCLSTDVLKQIEQII
jgi:DnaJ-class molecular chaperone